MPPSLRHALAWSCAALALTGCFITLEPHEDLGFDAGLSEPPPPGACRLFEACDDGGDPGHCDDEGRCCGCLAADPSDPGSGLTCRDGTEDTACRAGTWACRDCTTEGLRCGPSGCR